MSGKKLLVAPVGLKNLHSLPLAIRHSILRTQHQETISIYSLRTLSHSSSTSTPPDRIVRPLVPPPREGSGPLLSRRPDRALPDLASSTSVWLKTLPIFVLVITLSSLAIFNYEKSSSSTVSSILYALRTNIHARELLGDEIYFGSQVPWISGQLSPMQGTIDISFWVKGTKGLAKTRFVAVKRRGGFFETLEWSLKTEAGREMQLLEMEGTRDPLEGQRFD